MDTTNTQTPTDLTQQDLDELAALDQRFDVAIEITRLQEVAQKIETEGTPEMKAKLKPFKEHYNGDIMTLITKRTKQNFDNDVWQDITKAGDEAKAKYRQNPEGYLSKDKRAEYWTKAYDKTVDEARKLTQNLEQVLQSAPTSTSTTSPVPETTQPKTPRRRLFNR